MMRDLPWIDDLERLRLTAQEFTDLLDYSASIPTGVFIGKRWKCLVGAFDPKYRGQCRWIVREYIQHPTDPKLAKVKNYKPVVIVRAA